MEVYEEKEKCSIKVRRRKLNLGGHAHRHAEAMENFEVLLEPKHGKKMLIRQKRQY